MYDEGPLLPVYQQRKVFEFDPIGKVMFGNDDLKVSRGNIQQNCLVPQKNPDLESIIIDISEIIDLPHTGWQQRQQQAADFEYVDSHRHPFI